MRQIDSSKEASELAAHLRNVHFALIIVCLTLWAVVLYGREGKVASALSSINEIQVLLDNYNLDWINTYFKGGANSLFIKIKDIELTDWFERDSNPPIKDTNGNILVPNPVGIYREQWLEKSKNDREIIFGFYQNFFKLEPKFNYRALFFDPGYFDDIASDQFRNLANTTERNYIIRTDDFLNKFFTLSDIIEKNKKNGDVVTKDVTLKMFKEWWEMLRTDKQVDITKIAHSPIVASDIDFDYETTYDEENWSAAKLETISEFYMFAGSAKEKVIQDIMGDENPALLGKLEKMNTEFRSNAYIYCYDIHGAIFSGTTTRVNVFVPVQAHTIKGVALKRFIDSFNPNIRYASFDLAFPALAELTENFQSSSLSQIQIMLESPAFSSGGTLELLSVKFPKELAAKIGAFIVFSIQLYLFIHLNEMVKISINAERWRYPWICLYEGRIPYLTSILTLLLAPIGTSCMLLVQSMFDISQQNTGSMAIQITFFVFSCVLGYKCVQKFRELRSIVLTTP